MPQLLFFAVNLNWVITLKYCSIYWLHFCSFSAANNQKKTSSSSSVIYLTFINHYMQQIFFHCCSALHKNIYIGLIYKNHSFFFILVCCKFFFFCFFVILVFISNPHNVKRVQSIYISGGSILNIHVRVNIIVVFVVSFFCFCVPSKM